jgi:hypothetical protein
LPGHLPACTFVLRNVSLTIKPLKMKKKLPISLLALFTMFRGASQLSNQEKDLVTNLPKFAASSRILVNNEIDKALREEFRGTHNLTWYEINKCYLLKFTENDIKHQTLFTKKGSIKYDISYGDEEFLPKYIRSKIMDVYDEYNITKATNIKEAGHCIWVINLENLKYFVLVRMEEDEMEEVQKLKK